MTASGPIDRGRCGALQRSPLSRAASVAWEPPSGPATTAGRPHHAGRAREDQAVDVALGAGGVQVGRPFRCVHEHPPGHAAGGTPPGRFRPGGGCPTGGRPPPPPADKGFRGRGRRARRPPTCGRRRPLSPRPRPAPPGRRPHRPHPPAPRTPRAGRRLEPGTQGRRRSRGMAWLSASSGGDPLPEATEQSPTHGRGAVPAVWWCSLHHGPRLVRLPGRCHALFASPRSPGPPKVCHRVQPDPQVCPLARFPVPARGRHHRRAVSRCRQRVGVGFRAQRRTQLAVPCDAVAVSSASDDPSGVVRQASRASAGKVTATQAARHRHAICARRCEPTAAARARR